jgi:hypothetical protein
MESFVRKYAAIMGKTTDAIRSLFIFRPVRIGEPTTINGAIFVFHYSLHSIPCIGFTFIKGSESVYLSGDTYYDPEGLKQMMDKGVLSLARSTQFID